MAGTATHLIARCVWNDIANIYLVRVPILIGEYPGQLNVGIDRTW